MSVTGSASSSNLNCLKGKIASLAPYAVDPTLSEEGSAAEAKAVGDALEKKVSFTDIVDNLNTSDADRVLSAKQGVQLKQNIENLRLSTSESISNMEHDMDVLENSVMGANNNATSAQTAAKAAQTTADGKMSPDGSVPMTGNLDMGENKVVNVADPETDTDAANKKFVEKYVDSKTFSPENIKLKADSWASTTGEAPYFQEVAVDGILATDRPHWGLVYSDGQDTRQLEKEAYALVDLLDSEDNKVIFTCFEERPETDLTIQLEVNR